LKDPEIILKNAVVMFEPSPARPCKNNLRQLSRHVKLCYTRTTGYFVRRRQEYDFNCLDEITRYRMGEYMTPQKWMGE